MDIQEEYDNLQENKYEYEYEYDNSYDNTKEYKNIYDSIRGVTDDQILLKRIILYLINFESKDIISYNKLRFFTELLLNEENINIFICISSKFDPNFYLHDKLDINFRTPELDFYLKNRTELYKNKNFNLQFYIDSNLEWLYDNIIALNRWNNNTDELCEDIKFKKPPYFESIIKNFKTSYKHYLKKIKKENNKINKRVIITYK